MPETPKQQLSRLCAADYDPKLTSDELDVILESAQRPDAEGYVPGDIGYTVTYDMNAAIGSGWETKAGRAAADFRFEEDNQSFYREQVYRACAERAKRYNRRLVQVPMTAETGLE
jgi:hypothetical protein